jgi:hypothetical protein
MATTTTKLERLTMIRAALIKCRKESLWDNDEWNTYNDMQQRIGDMIHKERKRCGWSGVYEIVDGCAGDRLFEGDSEQCKIYADIMLEQHPERCGNIKILPIY